MTPVDLRSDTVTTPTPEMRRAMADAEVGDDAYGEDPTVNRLQSLAAALTGTEAALLVPSGTMANQIALRLHAAHGHEVLCAERAHVYRYESGGAAANSGIQLRPLSDGGGALTAEQIAAVAGDSEFHLPPIAALTIENTYMPASGRPWRPAELAPAISAARGCGLAIHVDGARIWNAAVATGESPAALCAGVDTVMFCLSKGLSAPVGSILCGPRDLIERARLTRHRLGGGMRQAGVLAAAGIVGLETMVERLADDHTRAHHLAEALADRFPGSIDPATVETNIVCARRDALPDRVVERLGERNVRVGVIDASTVRFVTHKDVDDDGLAATIAALDDLVREAMTTAPTTGPATDDAPESALAVYAHPDDPEISAGGTLARWADAGSRVAILVTTQGEKGSVDPDADLGALAELRREEAAAAAAVLGVTDVIHLGYRDGDLVDDPDLRGALVREVRAFRPEVVLCPDPTAVFFAGSYFNHRDHRVTGFAALDAIAPAAGNPHYFPEHLAEGLRVHHVRSVLLSGTLYPDTWIDIEATLERKIDALFCHASQLHETGEWFREFLRRSAEDAGRAAGVRYAESFRRLDLGA